MADPVKLVDPPVDAPPLMVGDSGVQQFSHAWTAHNQDVADRINALQAAVDQIGAALGSAGIGITDGSNAAAGHVGEYLTASGSFGLTSSATHGIVSLNLTAGDWDVSGNAMFVTDSGTHSQFAAGIGGLDTVYQGTFPSVIIAPAISTATRRYNLTASTTAVELQAQAVFTGTVTCNGSIRARRMR